MEAMFAELFRFAVAALLLHFALEALRSIPMLQGFLNTNSIGKLVVYIIGMAAAGALLWLLPDLRMLHALNFVRKAKDLVWPDIILTALALVHMSQVWPRIFEWIDRQNQ